MRIEAYNQIAQLYQTTNNKSSVTQASSVSKARDQVSISSTGQDYQVAKTAVSEASDIREDLVADVKERIKAGTYEVSTDMLADKLINQFGTMEI